MRRTVTLALDLYDRHIPFFRNQLAVPPEFELIPLEVGMAPPRQHGIDRHGRMLRGMEFDAAETSLASYIIAKNNGAPFTAVPVFPRRLFSQNHIFVRSDSELKIPQDLIGKRVICWAFQVTMSVLAKGDFKRDHGIDWRQLNWLAIFPEEINVAGVPITPLDPSEDPVDVLLRGEADAIIYPHPTAKALSNRDGVRRLFKDVPSECSSYLKRHGYYPIMHLLAIKQDLVDAHPSFPLQLMQLWEQAKVIADGYYHDPGYSLLALAEYHYQIQKNDWGNDLWQSGLAANRKNLEFFIDAMVDQKLLERPMPVDALFDPSTHHT